MFKKLIYLAPSILVLSLALAGGAKVADPNLIGWWPLNEGSGDVVTDLSGSGNDGTIQNADTGGLGDGGSVWLDDPERGTVISFNGTAQGAFVRAGSIPQMTLTNDFTWSFWAKHNAENTADNDIILGNRKDENAVDFVPRQFIKFTPTKFEWHMNGNGNDNLEYEDIPADVWLHHAVVKTADRLTYYRNGVEASSGKFTQPLDFPQPLFFGGDNEGAEGENWNGLMSDVRIYDRALTGLEVMALVKGVEQIDMEIGFALKPPAIDGQVDYVWDGASTQYFVPLADPADGSGTWKALYDAENLYVIVDVTDDSLQNDSVSSWQDDSVEIYFDGGNTKLNTPLSGDDHQYTFGWTADDIQGTNITGFTEGIEQAQVTTDTGWRIEVKMPWMSIWGVVPQASDLIGIDCYYNDDDDGGDSREGKMLGFSVVEGWNDASQWGTAILAAMPEPVDPGTNGLVAHYAFENDANDSSGNGLDGTIVGDPVFVDGAIGMGLQLDGVDDYVNLGNNPLFDITEQITLSVWVNTQDIGNTQNNPWLGKGDTSYMIKGFRTGNQIEFFVYEGGWHSAYADVGESFNGDWHHAAGTFDGEQLLIYVDGEISGKLDYVGGIAPSTYNVAIGTNTQASGRFSESIIDEAMIYNRALSINEILYLAGFRQNDPETNKVVARRFFEEMWNESRLDIVAELITSDMAGHAPTGEFTGYEGEKQTIQGTLVAFPDLQVTIDEIIAEGNKVALRTSYSGTHTGTLMGQIPPTGKSVQMTGSIIFQFENGKVAEAWSFADMLGIMQQIDAASPPRPTPEDYAWSAPSDATGEPGDPETNKTLVLRFVNEVWNQQKLEVMDEIFSSDVVSHNPPIEYQYGRSNLEILKQGVIDYLATYPDLHVVLDDTVAEGGIISARWTLSGTHLGILMGIPPTGKTVTFAGITMYRFADGKIVELWWAWDTMGMIRQISQP